MKCIRFAAALAASILSSAAPGQSLAPGAPGQTESWSPANKHGFGTSRTLNSKVWFTLGGSGLTEVYYPYVDSPSIRDLQLVVSDGVSFTERESDATNTVTSLLNDTGMLYAQTQVAKSGRYKIVKSYVTDPARSVLLVNVEFSSLDGKPYQVYALLNPGPNNDLVDTLGETQGKALLASNGAVASAFLAAPGFVKTSNGYLGVSDGWQDLRVHHALTWGFQTATKGNVVQTGQTTLDGVTQTSVTLAVGFGATTAAALGSANRSLAASFATTSNSYVAGWANYLAKIKKPPSQLTARERSLYNISVELLAAHEDKTFRGAFIASPTMPWGFGLDAPSDAYHLIWSRDLYQIATGLLAAGDRAAAVRAMLYLFDTQQKSDGSFPQNSHLDGGAVWGGLQMDEVGFPIILAWQLNQADSALYWSHIKPAADFIVAHGPYTPGERWENQGGYSPASIAAEIAGLVCAADLASRNGDTASATTYLSTADQWQAGVAGWTATSNGPFSPQPYYLRLTKDQQPNTGTTYSLGDSGRDNVDQRAIVDPGFLELVRLGVKPASDPTIQNTVAVIDAQLGASTPNGVFWHRYNFDGYGEQADGSMWSSGFPGGSQTTRGRLWPIFAGERAEYELLANQQTAATGRLASMAATANDGFLIPEQVWDLNAPGGQPGFGPGAATTSATPLAWSHAQYVRLVWSLVARHPVEQPTIVACRYTRVCAR